MKTADLRKYMGKEILFTTDRSRLSLYPKRGGVLEEIVKGEAYIGGDWHNIKSIIIIEE